MTRIPYPDVETLSPAKKAVFADTGRRVLNVSKMAMHSPDGLWAANAELGRQAVFGSTLDKRLREILILRVAYISKSEYELHHHLGIAKNVGVDEATRAGLESGDFDGFAPQDRALADFVNEVVLNVSPSDATLAAARGFFPDSQIFEMVVLIGSYMTTARMAGVSGVDCDAEPMDAWPAKPWNQPGSVPA